MPESNDSLEKTAYRRIGRLGVGFALLLFASPVLDHLHNTSEMNAVEEKNYQACFYIACLCALLAAGLTIYLSPKLSLTARIMRPLMLGIEAAICSTFVTYPVSQIIEGARDFPAGKIELMPAWTWPDETGYYEVASDGRFCARLAIETSATSVRILHDTSAQLPTGSVVLCP